MSIMENLKNGVNTNNKGEIVMNEKLGNTLGAAMERVITKDEVVKEEPKKSKVAELFAKKAAEVAAKKEATKVETIKKNAEEKAAKELEERRAAAAKRKEERATERAKEKFSNTIHAIGTVAKLNAIMANKQKPMPKGLAANKIAKVLDVNKKRMSVKNQTNLINVIFNGYNDDPDVKLDDEQDLSAVVYIQTMESELLRGLKKIWPVVKEDTRFIGNNKVQTIRKVDNIQDAVAIVTVKVADNVGKSMYRIFVTNDEVYVNIEGSKDLIGIVSSKKFNMDVLKDKTFKVYEGLLYSPSQEKKESITAFKVFEGVLADYNEEAITTGENKIISVLDDITNGMLTILRKKGLMNFKKAVKANARLSQILSPSEVLGICSSYALILDDELTVFADGGSLYRALFINSCLRNNYMEGFPIPEGASAGKYIQARPLGIKGGFAGARDNMIKACLNDLNVIKLKRDEITPEIQEQLELAFDGKGKFAPVTLSYIDGNIYKLEGDINVPYTIEDEQLKKDIIDSFNGNGRFRINNGTLRLVTVAFIVDNMNITVPDFTCDLNNFKAPVDFTRQAKFVALDESKGVDGTGRLSIQMALTLLLNNKKGIEYLENTMMKNVEDSFSKLMDPETKDPTIESFSKFFLSGQLQSTAKHFVLNHDAPAFRTMVDHWINGQISNFKRFNVLTKHSGFNRLCPDWSLRASGVRVLDEGECYSDDVNIAYDRMLNEKADAVITTQPESDSNKITRKMLSKAKSIDDIKVTTDEATLKAAKEYFAFREKDHTVIVFRSPKMGLAEFARLRSLTRKELTARIKERIHDKETQEAVLEFYLDLKPGTFILPAFEKYKDLLGGADFDFDGITIICDQDFIAAMEGIKPQVISVKKAKGTDNEKIYSVGKFKEVFDMAIKQWFNNDMGIGQITNMNDLVCLLLFVDDDIVRKIIRKNFVHETINPLKPYVSPLKANAEGVIEIDDALTNEVVERIKNAALKTHQEIVDIIFDLNVVLRGYQERTIDASKSGEVIKVLFNLLQDCTLLALADKPDFSIDWTNHKVINKVRRNETSAFKMKKGKRAGEFAFIINDEFHKILVKAYDLLQAKAEKLIEHEGEIRLTADHLRMLSDINKNYPGFEESLLYIRKRFNEANGIRLSKINNLRDKNGKISKFVRKVLIPNISEEYNKTIKGITMMTRSLLMDVPAVDRAALLKYIAIHSKDEDNNVTLNENGGSTLCHTILPEEYLLLVMALDDKAARFARSKVYGAGKYKEGDVATVVDGISVEENSNAPSFIGDKNINGKFTIEKDTDGSAYLVEDIENLINIEVPTKRTVVIKLAPKTKGGSYKSIIKELDNTMNLGVRLTAYGKKCKEDRVELIKDEVAKRLCKFVAPSGTSPLGKVMDGFVGNIVSVNYNKNVFETEDGSTRSYYTILVVAEEADIKFTKVNPFAAFNAPMQEAAVDTTKSKMTAKELLASFRANKVADNNSNRFASIKDDGSSILKDFGGYDDPDIDNFLKGLRTK